jgi:hypothetical protein
MKNLLQNLLVLLMLAPLSACFKTELGGAVAGASVTITELRSGAFVEGDLKSKDLADFLAEKTQEQWDAQSDLGKMINLGNFFVDGNNFDPNVLYLVSVTNGGDMDPDMDGTVNNPFTAVAGTWHAIMKGQHLKTGGYNISLITEALYQSVKDDIPQLTDNQVMSRLHQDSAEILSEVNGKAPVNYIDALSWTVLFHKNNYLLNPNLLQGLSAAIQQGAGEAEIEDQAMAVMGASEDPLDFFADNISGPIIQGKCVNCHTAGGRAPNSGARLIVVTNSNPNHIAMNHEAFITLRNLISPADLSDHVTAKASAQVSHGGGRQLNPASQDFANLEIYLNMIE